MTKIRFQTFGIALLIVFGFVRPLVFLIRPPATAAILENGPLYMTSPLPLVFDRPAYFGEWKVLLHTDSGSLDGRFFSVISERPWSSWGAAYVHFFFRIPTDGSALGEQDEKLARKLFCQSRLYPWLLEDLRGVTLILSFGNHELKAEIKCNEA